jgi:hypothetical protein
MSIAILLIRSPTTCLMNPKALQATKAIPPAIRSRRSIMPPPTHVAEVTAPRRLSLPF